MCATYLEYSSCTATRFCFLVVERRRRRQRRGRREWSSEGRRSDGEKRSELKNKRLKTAKNLSGQGNIHNKEKTVGRVVRA